LLEALRQADAGPGVVAAALVAAAAWGAGHALTPGHGKALAAAYLIGSRSTPVHAFILGLTVTATHTLGVFALGLVALFASRYVLPEQLTPWLELLSGAIVVVLGAALLVGRTRRLLAAGETHHHHGHDHSHSRQGHHDHDHGHPRGTHHLHASDPPAEGGAPVTPRALLGLGVSGGLVPCPAALVLLLAAVSVDRTAFGMALVLAFSVGLAGVLTAVGLLFVKGSALLQRLPRAPAAAGLLPVASALFILVLGGWLTAESAHHLWP
jgi:ABC-type nickel/cobalt efflux system permease component RcnA